ncbi:SDR family oxidoreductase [Streptomyces sp. NPDC002490]|uniref:SDR family oxidoreductase n=1 Tax=Streptomyces sp. NPDC002490 TaxID=3154416 RepID=UPI003327D408
MGSRAERGRRVRTDGVELCVVEAGDPARPTVVLVHGYPDTKEVWDEVAARLVDRHDLHVVRYDVRGHGGSTAPGTPAGGYTLEKLTGDFLAVADAVSPHAPVHLVGHDWGSVQGWEFVTVDRTRGRIASFTSVSGPSLDHFGHWAAGRRARPTPRAAAQLLGQTARFWYVAALHAPGVAERAWRSGLGRRWPGFLARAHRVPPGAHPAPSTPSDGARGAWLYRDNVRPRVRAPRADAYAHVPVQLVVPSDDAFVSPAVFDGLERWVPELTRRTLDARHWVPRTHPDRLATWVADFVAAHHAGETAAAAAGATRATGRRGRRADRYAERFAGLLVLVTGAGKGIGRATALAFARAGARVVVVDRDAVSARRTVREARAAGAAGAWSEAVDVGDGDAMAELAARVHAEHGVVDVLVNNAGVGLAGPFLDTTPEEWRRALDVNLWGVVHGCRLFGAGMAERGQGGHIVNIASAAAFLPSRTMPVYGATKAAVLALSESLRAELAGRGIGVSAICPGIVRTDIAATTRFAGADAAEQERRRTSANRLYRLRGYPPERVARAVLGAVVRDRPVVAVSPEARAVRALARYAPKVLRRAARFGSPR